MTPEVLAALMFLGVFAGIFLGFPIAFTLAGVSIIVGYIGLGNIVFPMAGYQINTVLGEFAYIAVPLFVFMGCMLERSGVADAAFGALSQWLGKVRGGLGIATVILCMVFAACVGILGASVATIGLLALKPMIERGYDKGLATGVVAAGGSLGVLLPPSIVLILFGQAAKVTVTKLFIAAIIPGLLLGLFYAVYVGLIGYFKEGAVPKIDETGETRRKYSLRQGISAFLPFAILISMVVGVIFFGIAAPTEVAAFGALGSVVIAAGHKKCSIRVFREAAISALAVSSMVIFIAIGASVFTSVFFRIDGASVLRKAIEGVGLGPSGVFALFLISVFVLGIFIDWLGVTMILIPIFMPMLAEFGFDPLIVSITVLVLLQTSFLTPPFAQAILYVMGVAPPEVHIGEAYRGALPFIFIQIAVVLICIFFPSAVTFLPDLMFKPW